MTIEEQFTEIISKEQTKQLFPFLKGLKPGDKKSLSSVIKKVTKDFSQIGQIKKNTWGHIKGTDKQRNMLNLACFVCLNEADYSKSPSPLWFLHESNLRPVISWYVPDWFNSYVNKTAGLEHFSLKYDWIMELTDMGALQPSKELIVKSMPEMIFENKDKEWHYIPGNLLKRPITLQEHIWYLFEMESNLHYAHRFIYFKKEIDKSKIGWPHVFKQFSAEGKIERRRLLKESLLASNKNFNKVLSGWFAQLFADLEPAVEELIPLQKELCAVLNSPHSKVVNTALQAIKSIINEKDFDTRAFLDATPVLLTSETKATVISSLQLLETIAKRHEELRGQVAIQACQVFMSPSEELQARAAKLIVDNRQWLGPSFGETLAPFFDSLLATAKKLLRDVVTMPAGGPMEPPGPDAVPGPVENAFTEIPPIENMDDLVFLASQAFDNNEPWHLEQLADSLVKFTPGLAPADIPLFEPAFQRALNIAGKGLRSNMGYLEQLLAMFFIDFGNYLMRVFPESAESIRKIYTKYDQVNGESRSSWTISPEYSTYTETWEPYSKIEAYGPIKHLLVISLQKIVQGDDLPALSFPTHAPGWIMPELLIERLASYQARSKDPDAIDLQIAISRCYLDGELDAAINGAEKLSGEFQHLIQFLLGQTAESIGPFTSKGAWMTAALLKKRKTGMDAFDRFPWHKHSISRYTGQHRWESVEEEYESSEYDYQTRSSIPVTRKHKIMRVFIEEQPQKPAGLKKILARFALNKEDPAADFLFDQLRLKTQWLSSEINDIRRILLLTPNNPEPLLADAINQSLKYPNFFSEPDKQCVIAILQTLLEIWDGFGEMAHVFIGTCLMSSDKTASQLAAEIWIHAVWTDRINSEKIGEVIGRHESIEFYPLKRFTDLAMQRLFRVSDRLNRALQVVVENILIQLPEKPITNLKKLLEIYGEILSANGSGAGDASIMKKLEAWKKTSGLKHAVSSCLERT